jgi:hypothetical protein
MIFSSSQIDAVIVMMMAVAAYVGSALRTLMTRVDAEIVRQSAENRPTPNQSQLKHRFLKNC